MKFAAHPAKREKPHCIAKLSVYNAELSDMKVICAKYGPIQIVTVEKVPIIPVLEIEVLCRDAQTARALDDAWFLIGHNHHPPLSRLNGEHLLTPMDFRPSRHGKGGMGQDGALRCNKACIGLIDNRILVRELVAGEALRRLTSGQHLVREVVFPARTNAPWTIRLSSVPASIPPVTNRSCSFVSCSVSRHNS